jgi:glycosyltransferase involved in cell wall biosynthesis
MNNVMVHVNNVCWLGGTMLHTLTVCKAYPEFKHVVYYVHRGANKQMHALLTEAGVETRLLVNRTLHRADIASLDPALVILNNTSSKFVEGEWPHDWLREWPTIYYHHSPVSPIIPADLDIFNSRHLYKRFENCRERMQAVRFIGSYINTDEFEARRPRRSTDGRVVIGKLASDQKVKFPPVLPRVLERIEDIHGPGKVAFEIVGGSKYYPKLGERLTVYQAPDFGSSSAPDFYARWDVLLYVTTDDYTETWCRVITEAMASGLAIVAENKGAIPEQIDHGEEGLLIPRSVAGNGVSQEDADLHWESAYVTALDDLVYHASARRALGENAREKAVREFSIPAFRRKTIDALMGVMAGIRIESEA